MSIYNEYIKISNEFKWGLENPQYLENEIPKHRLAHLLAWGKSVYNLITQAVACDLLSSQQAIDAFSIAIEIIELECHNLMTVNPEENIGRRIEAAYEYTPNPNDTDSSPRINYDALREEKRVELYRRFIQLFKDIKSHLFYTDLFMILEQSLLAKEDVNFHSSCLITALDYINLIAIYEDDPWSKIDPIPETPYHDSAENDSRILDRMKGTLREMARTLVNLREGSSDELLPASLLFPEPMRRESSIFDDIIETGKSFLTSTPTKSAELSDTESNGALDTQSTRAFSQPGNKTTLNLYDSLRSLSIFNTQKINHRPTHSNLKYREIKKVNTEISGNKENITRNYCHQ
ncbi:MAG: hypothetical protein K2Q33_05455 [Gammaproteobacteria bacterium]|nr:hypothetical protein [Gammaproteobacteria bacterium]